MSYKPVTEYFDKTYCINLDKRPDRWELAKTEFDKHDLNVERFSAIVGNPDNIPTKIVPGHAGCVLSHYNCVKIAKESGLDNLLMLEDDVEFAENLNQWFAKYFPQVPDDWDLLYFGGNHNNKPFVKQVGPNVFKTENTYTTHCYAIKNTLFDVVINMFPKLRYEVDVMYSLMQRGYNAYVIRPHLAWQRDGYSDILERNVNYDFLRK